MTYKRPNVTIIQGNGTLGKIADSLDGVSLLVISSPTYTATEYVYFSQRQAENAGLTEANDSDNTALVWEHIKDFYSEAPEGTELHVLIVPDTTTLTNLFTGGHATNTTLKNYLRDKAGRIRLIGAALNPAAAESAPTAGVTPDLLTAIPLAQALAAGEFARFRPVNIVLEGRVFTGTSANASDLRAKASDSVSVMIGRDQLRRDALVTNVGAVAGNYAAVGLLLGRLAGIPVQRNIGRVKSGPLAGITQASLSGGTTVSTLDEADLSLLTEKAYVFALQHAGKDGFFFNDDPTCTVITDDYGQLASKRVINKASRIARAVYLEELLDDVRVDPATGRLARIEVARFQNVLLNAIEAEMVPAGEIVAASVYVDPSQNVISTSKIVAKLRCTPVGTGRQIEATVEFFNPANA